MTTYLSTSIVGIIVIVALITPMFALALPCTRSVSSPSGLSDLKALMTRFR